AANGTGSDTLGIWLSGGVFGTANGGKGTLVGTVSVSVSGTVTAQPWSFDLTTSSNVNAQSLADGTYTIHVTVGTSTGATDLTSNSFTEDHTAPTQTTTISSIVDNAGTITGTVPPGGLTDDTSPTLNGTISASLGTGDVVAIYRDSVKVGTASVTGTNWTF